MQVVRFPVVDAHYTEQQLAVQSQGQRTASSTLRPDDDLNVFIDLVLQHLGLGELLVLVGGQPYASKLARLEEEVLGKEHGGGAWRLRLRGVKRWTRRRRCCLRRRVGSKWMRKRYARADDFENRCQRFAQSSNGSESHKRPDSDGGMDARVGVGGRCCEAGRWLEEGTTDLCHHCCNQLKDRRTHNNALLRRSLHRSNFAPNNK